MRNWEGFCEFFSRWDFYPCSRFLSQVSDCRTVHVACATCFDKVTPTRQDVELASKRIRHIYIIDLEKVSCKEITSIFAHRLT